jgi:hypothetical protein
MNQNIINATKTNKDPSKIFLLYGSHIIALMLAILITVINHLDEIKIDISQINLIQTNISSKTIITTIIAMIIMIIGLTINLMAMGKITRKIVEIHVYRNIKYKTLIKHIIIGTSIMLLAYLIIKLN